MEELGKVAYDAYREATHGVSLISSSVLPPWEQLNPDIREAWDKAADAVVQAKS